MLLVRQTFITPFDRIDIQNLFRSLDDSIDQMKKTAKAITLFLATNFGAPVSTTHTTTGAMGAMFYGLTTLFG